MHALILSIRRVNTVHKIFLALLLLLFANSAFAVCQGNSTTVGLPAVTYNQGSGGTAPGQPLSGWSNVDGIINIIDATNCQYHVWLAQIKDVETPVPGLTYSDGLNTYPIYPTGIDNIGYILMVKDPNATDFGPVTPDYTTTYPAPGTINAPAGIIGIRAQIRLIATGPLSPGIYTLPSKLVAQMDGWAWSGGPHTAGTGYIYFGGTTVTVTGNGCLVTTPMNQSVTLPNVAQGEFTGVGSTPSERSPVVNVSVKCDAGVAVYATMTDATTAGNLTNILSLTPSSTAQGVGIQVFHDGQSTPVTFGPPSGTPDGNPAQWFVGSNPGTATYTIPFTASYIQTENSVSAGSVTGRATVTFTYQ
jgi:type 1 fimbria pilin